LLTRKKDRKQFFFEKKNQKTFTYAPDLPLPMGS